MYAYANITVVTILKTSGMMHTVKHPSAIIVKYQHCWNTARPIKLVIWNSYSIIYRIYLLLFTVVANDSYGC